MVAFFIQLGIENVVEQYFKAKNRYEKELKVSSKLNLLRKLIKIMLNFSSDFHLVLQGPEPVIKTIDSLIRHVSVNHAIRYGVRIELSMEDVEAKRNELEAFKSSLRVLTPYIDFDASNPWLSFLYHHPSISQEKIITEAEYLLHLKYGFRYNVEACKSKYRRNPYDEYLEDRIIEHILKSFYLTLRLELKVRLENNNTGDERSSSRCMFLDKCLEFMNDNEFERFIYLHDNIKFITENYSVNAFMLKLLGKLELLPECKG